MGIFCRIHPLNCTPPRPPHASWHAPTHTHRFGTTAGIFRFSSVHISGAQGSVEDDNRYLTEVRQWTETYGRRVKEYARSVLPVGAGSGLA